MLFSANTFAFDHLGCDVVYGRGCIAELESHLAARNLSNGLVVCGSNVGANDDVMKPVKWGLGDRLAGVFDETTPSKSIETVYEGIEMAKRLDADFQIGVGGGSSLDIARQISVFAADGRSLSTLRDNARANRLQSPDPEEPLTPVVVIPTTFAGADLSSGGSVEVLSAEESPTEHPIRISGSAAPDVAVYDPDLFATTPRGALAGSAMNGFNKGIETIYAPNSTPITDATAVRGLRLLRDAFPKLPDDPDAFERAVIGLILVQFERQISIIHAFGHGFARRYPVQQGVVHAVVVPHVLRYVFENGGGRRELLSEAFDVDAATTSATELSEEIIEEVVAVRDSFGLPTRLRDVDAIAEGDLPSIAESILDDDAMRQAPEGLDPSAEEIEVVLREAW